MASACPEIGYIDEPFNVKHGFTGKRFVHWFTYITGENEAEYYSYINRALGFHYDLMGELRAASSFPYLWRAPRDYVLSLWHRTRGAIPLIKDPIAVLSSEWLAERFDMRVIVLIRHPAAFVSSLKVKSWTFPFSHFLEQPLLLRDWLQPFEGQIRDYTHDEREIVDQGILLWKIIYSVVAQYRRDHPDWLFLRHEDIACDPVGHFQSMYQKLELEFTPAIRSVVQKHSAESNPSEEPNLGSPLKRDSKATIWNWKRRLSKTEIYEIRTEVEDIASEFYSDDDW
jgi:hypothetical protein